MKVGFENKNLKASVLPTCCLSTDLVATVVNKMSSVKFNPSG